ncbi:mate-domain-containing protein [Fennellomyces sp. T-0311]|nr:mate-domain-containing protein [Fennellomyces sp. T-0311]
MLRSKSELDKLRDLQDNDECIALLDQDPQRAESYSEHFRWMFWSVLPLVSMKFIHQASTLFTVSAVGHMGAQELAGMSLANSYINLTTKPLSLGMASALDTLCSQAWTGSKDKTVVGLYFQRAMHIFNMLMIPIAMGGIVYLSLLRDRSTDPQVVHNSGIYAVLMIPGVISYAGYHFLTSVLQAQGIMRIGAYGSVIAAPVTMIATYVFIVGKPFELGIAGAALADTFASLTILAFMAVYMLKIAGHEAWGGWSFQGWRNFGPVIRLFTPGALLMIFQFSIPQVCTLWAASMGTKFLAAHYILVRTNELLLSIEHGLKHATITRIGNTLGKGSLLDLKRAMLTSLSFAVVIGVTCSTIFIVFRETISSIYTNDEVVARIVSEAVPIVAIAQLVQPMGNAAMGICDGLGHQRISMVATFVAYLSIGLPICYYFAFTRGLGVIGLWVGLTAAHLSVGVFLFFHLWRVDWFNQVLETRQRIAKEEEYH